MSEGDETTPHDWRYPADIDDEDPYEGKDLDQYPAWWQDNIREFREHGMRPYRPPLFKDGGIVPQTVQECEEEFGVRIQLRTVDPGVNDDWEVVVDDRSITTVGRRRDGDGYSVYELRTDSFIDIVKKAASPD